jgi:sialate O-acetylesterase
MTVGDRISMRNVMVGEVWVCAGQSNMAKPVGLHPGQKPCPNYKKEIAAADDPQIRDVPHRPAE